MINANSLDRGPTIVCVAGPNGAGKSTFYHAYLAPAGLRFVNADILARELQLDPYQAASLADALRRQLVKARESFVFETVFSDEKGDKLSFLQHAIDCGYQVILCYIGLSDWETSQQRVSMRVSQGGHDVPDDKLESRFPRTLSNLRQAISCLPLVLVYDNGDLNTLFRQIATFVSGQAVESNNSPPAWLAPLLKGNTP